MVDFVINGVADAEIATKLKSRLAHVAKRAKSASHAKADETAPTGELEVPALIASYLTCLHEDRRAATLHAQKLEMRLRQFELRLSSLEGRFDGFEQTQEETLGKLSAISEIMDPGAGEAILTAEQVSSVVTAVNANFVNKIVAAFEEVTRSLGDIGALRADLEAAFSRLETKITATLAAE